MLTRLSQHHLVRQFSNTQSAGFVVGLTEIVISGRGGGAGHTMCKQGGHLGRGQNGRRTVQDYFLEREQKSQSGLAQILVLIRTLFWRLPRVTATTLSNNNNILRAVSALGEVQWFCMKGESRQITRGSSVSMETPLGFNQGYKCMWILFDTLVRLY